MGPDGNLLSLPFLKDIMKRIFCISIIIIMLSNTARAEIMSAIVGGAIAGSIVSDGARQAGNNVANAIKKQKNDKCLISFQNSNNKEIALDYNEIAGIDTWECDISETCNGWGCKKKKCSLIFFNNGNFGVYTFLTPSEILKLGKEQCQ